MLKTTQQKRSVSMFEEEEDQLLAFKSTEASSCLVEMKMLELPSTYIEESLPSDKLVDDFITREMLQDFQVKQQSYPHSKAADTTEESEDEWRRHYQSDWSHSTCHSSHKEDYRYSATSPFVNTVCAAQDLTLENQYVTKLEDEETDSTSTMLKTEDLEGQLSGEIEDLQIKVNSFQDIGIQISIETPRDELFENSNPRYTNLSQNSFFLMNLSI